MQENNQTQKKLKWINVTQLLLDDRNFRFSEDKQGLSQKELLKIIDQDFDPLTIGKSLIDNGYFVEEPLVVIKKNSNNKYIVIEGNRRLAALKFLLDEDLRSLSQDKQTWFELARCMKEDLSRVPAIVYKNRDELTTVLGYRHISGIMKWNPLAKARFIHNLVKKKGENASFSEIAQEIGSRSDFVRKQYIAYRLFLQAKSLHIDTYKLEKNYSIFYRAITGTRPIAQFIGLKKGITPKDFRNPIPSNKEDALEEVIGYIHGTEKQKAVIRDSREISQLGEVLASKPALENLRITNNLQRAYELSDGEARRLIDNLKSASYFLDEALKDTHRHIDNLDVKSLVRRCIKTIQQIIINFPDIKKEFEKKK